MLHFKNGRVYYKGVSFVLPSEFFLDTNDDERPLDNGLRAWLNSNEDYCVQQSIIKTEKGTAEDLNKILHGDTVIVMSDLEEIQHNGLSGHRAMYMYGGDDGRQYFEMLLELPDDKQFSLLIETRDRNIHELLGLEEIQSLIREIRAE